VGEILLQFLMVALGGAVGAVLRFATTKAMAGKGPVSFGTFIVNFIGCLLICFIFFGFVGMGNLTKLLFFTGFFGAFTTMSSVSLETVEFSSGARYGRAFLVFLLNVTVCLAAGFLGRGLALFM
jgi:CrcB protein